MEFKQGANVYTDMGDRVGEISRVVMDPRSKAVTHLIVSKGFILKEDKVVAISLISSATPEGIRLRADAGDLEALPNFEEKYYIPVDEYEPRVEGALPTLYWYPPAGMLQTGGYQPVMPEVTEVTRSIPEESVALQEGAKVITADNQDMGHIEKVLTDVGTDRMTFFVIEKGLLHKEHKLIPSQWISQVNDEEVRLAVNASQIEQLKPYEA